MRSASKLWLNAKQLLRPLWRSAWQPLTIFASSGLLILALTLLPYLAARHTARVQAQRTATGAAQANATAGLLGADSGLANVQLGQVGPAKQFSAALTASARSFKPANLSLPVAILPPLLPSNLFAARYVAQVNHAGRQSSTAERTTNAALQKARVFLLHDAAVDADLVNILSYNPIADFTTFDLHSNDTKKRLSLAKAGLSKTKQELSSLNSPVDPTLPKVIATIATLQSARDRLAAGGSVDDWTAAVGLAQAGIVQNRLDYWQTQGRPIAQHLTATADQLSAANAAWSVLATGRLTR